MLRSTFLPSRYRRNLPPCQLTLLSRPHSGEWSTPETCIDSHDQSDARSHRYTCAWRPTEETGLTLARVKLWWIDGKLPPKPHQVVAW